MEAWSEYYEHEMEKIDRSKRRCKMAYILVITIWVIVQIICVVGESIK